MELLSGMRRQKGRRTSGQGLPARDSHGKSRNERRLSPGDIETEYRPSSDSRKSAVTAATDQGRRREAEPRDDAPRALTPWSIPEIRVIKDDQGRLRIDQADPATYGAYTASQFLATAKADPRYRDGMSKRPSAPSIKNTYVNAFGEPQEIGVREIFCRMDGDALVLT